MLSEVSSALSLWVHESKYNWMRTTFYVCVSLPEFTNIFRLQETVMWHLSTKKLLWNSQGNHNLNLSQFKTSQLNFPFFLTKVFLWLSISPHFNSVPPHPPPHPTPQENTEYLLALFSLGSNYLFYNISAAMFPLCYMYRDNFKWIQFKTNLKFVKIRDIIWRKRKSREESDYTE